MTEEEKIKIINDMTNNKFECPICHNHNFTVIDNYIKNYIITEENSIPQWAMPSVVFVCEQCGFMSQHALGIFNEELLQKIIEKKETKNDDVKIVISKTDLENSLNSTLKEKSETFIDKILKFFHKGV